MSNNLIHQVSGNAHTNIAAMPKHTFSTDNTAFVLQAQGLTGGPGSPPCFSGLDLGIPAGLTAVTGDEGTGKTSLLRLLAGDLPLQAGSRSTVNALWLNLALPEHDEATPEEVWAGLQAQCPQWNAARSIHHRIAWLARESSKPGRGKVERWTVQASAAWSAEHITDTDARVKAKLLRAFAELTGIRAEPAHADVHRWLYAKTITPLGVSHQYNPANGLGTCGDWHLGHRVEDAFVSGLELALAVCQSAKRL